MGSSGAAFSIETFTFVAEGGDVLLVRLPTVRWEAVETVQGPGPTPSVLGSSAGRGVPVVLALLWVGGRLVAAARDGRVGEAEADGDGGGLYPVADGELAQDAGDVDAGRLGADE